MASNQRPFYIALAVIVIGGIAFIVSRVMGSHSISIPANVVVTAADTSGFHGYGLGSPNAPVKVTEYGDLECPACGAFSMVDFPEIKAQLIDSGKVYWVFRDFPLDGVHRTPRVAMHAAACANDQGHYWDVQEAMFQTQTDWAMDADPMPALTDIVRKAGVDVNSWMACMKSGKYAGRIEASHNEAVALGIQSTPSFLIAGQIYPGLHSDQLVKIVDSLIQSAPPSAAAKTSPTLGGM